MIIKNNYKSKIIITLIDKTIISYSLNKECDLMLDIKSQINKKYEFIFMGNVVVERRQLKYFMIESI